MASEDICAGLETIQACHMCDGRLTPRGRAFLCALEHICQTYQCRLTVDGYDGIDIVEYEAGMPVLYAAGILDCLADDGEIASQKDGCDGAR